MKYIKIAALCLIGFSPVLADDYESDMALIKQAAKERHIKTVAQAETKVSQPENVSHASLVKIDTNLITQNNSHCYQPSKKIYNDAIDIPTDSFYDDALKDAKTEIKETRKDQVVVEQGVVSYPKDFPAKTKNRAEHKNGIVHKGKTDVNGKQVVVYNIDDLLCDVPNFESPLIQPVYVFDPDGGIQNMIQRREERDHRAKELEKLIQAVMKDEGTAVIVDP